MSIIRNDFTSNNDRTLILEDFACDRLELLREGDCSVTGLDLTVEEDGARSCFALEPDDARTLALTILQYLEEEKDANE